MFKRILVPLDGSLRAERALAVAARLAHAGSGEVILARIVATPVALRQDPTQPPLADAILAGERETAIAYLKDVSQRTELVEVATQMLVREAPAVAPALQEIIQTARADLVIICSHGRSGFTRWALGSVAQKIARHATVPTLVLRSDGQDLMGPTGDGPRTMRALVPLDGSPEAEMALEPAARLVSALAAPGQGALHLLHVVQADDTSGATDKTGDGGHEALRGEAERYLRSVAEHLQRETLATLAIAVAWSIVFDADVAAAILDQSAMVDQAQSLIAMASHGRSGVQLWTMGSVADRVLQTTALPLLIVHLQDAADAHRIPDAAAAGKLGDQIATWPGY
jgi:nucleotide-binding universal stress UspA family protein